MEPSSDGSAGNDLREAEQVVSATASQVKRLRYCVPGEASWKDTATGAPYLRRFIRDALSQTPYLGRSIWDVVSGTLHLRRIIWDEFWRNNGSTAFDYQ